MTKDNGDVKNKLEMELSLRANSVDEMKRLLIHLAEHLDDIEGQSGNDEFVLVRDRQTTH